MRLPQLGRATLEGTLAIRRAFSAWMAPHKDLTLRRPKHPRIHRWILMADARHKRRCFRTFSALYLRAYEAAQNACIQRNRKATVEPLKRYEPLPATLPPPPQFERYNPQREHEGDLEKQRHPASHAPTHPL